MCERACVVHVVVVLAQAEATDTAMCTHTCAHDFPVVEPASTPASLLSLPYATSLQVAAEVLDLFHLLPRQAVKFLETQAQGKPGLVVLTIELEEKLQAFSPAQAPIPSPHIKWSPYRTALARFLACFPQESVMYYLDSGRLSNPPYFGRLLDILRCGEAKPLLQALTGMTGHLEHLLRTQNAPHPLQKGPEGGLDSFPGNGTFMEQL